MVELIGFTGNLGSLSRRGTQRDKSRVSTWTFGEGIKESELLMEATIRDIEKHIAKLETVISAHEELFEKLLLASGMTPLAALELIEKTKKKKLASWLEFAEDANPALAASIDDREIEGLDPDFEDLP